MTNSRNKEVDLDDAEAGMVLAEAVLDAHGGTLLPGATTLTDSLLTSLRRRGIDKVFVVNNDISEEELKAEQERVQKRLEHLFRKCGADGASSALLQSITDYRLGSNA
jgi:hypothetical protein